MLGCGGDRLLLLEVKDLVIEYATESGPVHAVDGVSFDLDEGEALGLAGESGCGKTTTALALMRLLPYNGKIISGSIVFHGRDLVKASDMRIRKIRWKDISIIFQGAMNSLNPVRNIGRQIAEPIILHERVDEDEAMRRVGELLELVGIKYAGKVRGFDKPAAVYTDPKPPSPRGLAAASPDTRGQPTMPPSIPGAVPSLTNPPPGCVSPPRCKFAFARCTTAEPALAE